VTVSCGAVAFHAYPATIKSYNSLSFIGINAYKIQETIVKLLAMALFFVTVPAITIKLV
jgi:hypothetical protein